MTNNIKQAIAPYINTPMRLMQNEELENILFFDFNELSEDDKSDISDYYLDDDTLEYVLAGELVPIALLGLTDNPDSYAEMSHAGILLWDLRKNSSKTEILFFNINDDAELTILADMFDQLPLQPAQQNIEQSDVLSDIEVLTSEAYCASWDKIISLYQQDKPLEALAVLEELKNVLIPSSNIELMKMEINLLCDLERTDDVLMVVEDMLIESMRSAPELEFAGRAQLKVKAYEKALLTANEIFESLENDDNNKLRAYAYAIQGIAKYYTGNKAEGLEDLQQAKTLHATISIKFPEISTLLA